MAEQVASKVCLPSIVNSDISHKERVVCRLCDELSSELYKAQQEILSYEKVIQVLREELTNMDRRAWPVINPRRELLADQCRSSRPKDGWHKVPYTSRKTKPIKNSLLQIIPHTHNKFELLSNLKEVNDFPSRTNLIKPRSIQAKNLRLAKHNVLILGDSHAPGSAPRLQLNLGKDYSVSSFVIPGAQMKVITTTANEERKSLKSEDVLVIWGGSNNINKNNTREALSNLSECVKESKDANIVLINAPHRHDLIPESCVNKEVWKYNRLMRKVAKLYTNVQLLEVDLDRSHFTRHRMHMNSKGKDFLSQQLAIQINLIFNKPQPPPPIPIPWKLPNPEIINADSHNLNTDGRGWTGTRFQSNQDNRQSSKKNNKYKLLHTYGRTS
jgi:hypothetical protein